MTQNIFPTFYRDVFKFRGYTFNVWRNAEGRHPPPHKLCDVLCECVLSNMFKYMSWAVRSRVKLCRRQGINMRLWHRVSFFLFSSIKIINAIRGLSGKYRAYLYISGLALFFSIGRVASSKVIPTWLNNTFPAMFPLLERVLELTFRDGLECARRIIFNLRFVIESLSFKWCFEFWKQPKVTGGYVGTVRRLSKQCDTTGQLTECY